MSLEKKIIAYRALFTTNLVEDGVKPLQWTESNLKSFTATKLDFILKIAKSRKERYSDDFVKKVRLELLRRKCGLEPRSYFPL